MNDPKKEASIRFETAKQDAEKAVRIERKLDAECAAKKDKVIEALRADAAAYAAFQSDPLNVEKRAASKKTKDESDAAIKESQQAEESYYRAVWRSFLLSEGVKKAWQEVHAFTEGR